MGSITEVKVYPINGKPEMKLKANGSFIYDGVVRINFKLIEGPTGMFVGFPGQQSDKVDEKTGRKIFYPFVSIKDEAVRTQLNAAAITEYTKITGGTMSQGEAAGPTDQTTLEASKRNFTF